MMIKWGAICCLFCIPIMLLSQDFQIKLLQSENLSSNPGEVNTLVAELLNNTDNTIKANIQFSFPEEWKAFQNSFRLQLAPNRKVKKLVSFVVAYNAIAGKYAVNYTAENVETGDVFLQKKFEFSVNPTNKLEIVPMDIQPISRAGSTVTGTFWVKNLSNQQQKIELYSNRGEVTGDKIITIKPYDNRIVEVNSDLSIETRVESLHSFYLSGLIQGTEVRESAYVQTTILPVKDFSDKNRRQLPGYVSLNYLQQKINQRDATGWQGEFFVSGALGKTKKERLEVSLKGPDQQSNTDILLYDEYYATYETDRFQTRIGDHNFTLSRLTEFSRNARGVGIDLLLPEHQIGAFVAMPRFFPDLEYETGVYFTNKFTENNSVTFNYLQKQYTEDKGESSILSVSGQFLPVKNTRLEVELASGHGMNKKGHAAFFSLDNRLFEKVRITAAGIFASPHFDGYYQNTKNLYGSLNWSINSKLQLFANVAQDHRNAALDTLFQAAPFSRRDQIGFQWRMGNFSNFQIAIRQNNLEDRSANKIFHRKERLITAKIDRKHKNFGWNLRTEYGKFKNLLNNFEPDFQTIFRNTLSFDYEFNRTNISLFGNYINESSILYEGQKQLIYGGGISTRITPLSHLNIRYQNSYALEEYYRNRNTFNLTFIQNFLQHHQLSFNFRETLIRKTIENKDLFMSIKYTWNFNIPLEKPTPKGGILGYIYRNGNEPAKGIPLYINGKTAISDDNGQFKFKGLNPGIYPVLVDKSKLELHELPMEESPIMVEISPNLEQEINIELVRTGQLLGEISLKQGKPSPLLINQVSLNNYFVQVQKGGEIRRTITNDSGQFDFKDLRPGKWTLTILNPNNNKDIVLERTFFQIEIKGEEIAPVFVVAKKKQRKIRFKKIINFSDDDDDGDGGGS